MKNPEKLINNAAFRTLVRRAGFARSRAVFRRVLRPLLLRPSRMRELRDTVAGYLRLYFPELGETDVRARADAFVFHWSCKFAEDCVVLNTTSVAGFRKIIDERVTFAGKEHFHRAIRAEAGILAVSAHVGSVVLGTTALLSLFLEVPREEYPLVRMCAEPEAERYPGVLQVIEEALHDYGGDARFILTRGRDRKTVATEMTQMLEGGNLVTCNLDVLMGGRSQHPFPLFGKAEVILPALVGAARIALRSGATILPWVNIRTRSGFELTLEPPIFVPRLDEERIPDDHPEMVALCETLRGILERWIVEQPEQWVYWDRFAKRLVS